jgi:hypothetical protein
MPKTISYGGSAFDITVPPASYSGSANAAAANTTVVLLRPGWTTHAMNMGQRYLQLNSTYSVNDDGSIVLHTSQAPPNANLFTPGPALLFVVVNGVPSNGTMVTVGNGAIGTQPTTAAAALPPSSGLGICVRPSRELDERVVHQAQRRSARLRALVYICGRTRVDRGCRVAVSGALYRTILLDYYHSLTGHCELRSSVVTISLLSNHARCLRLPEAR